MVASSDIRLATEKLAVILKGPHLQVAWVWHGCKHHLLAGAVGRDGVPGRDDAAIAFKGRAGVHPAQVSGVQ